MSQSGRMTRAELGVEVGSEESDLLSRSDAAKYLNVKTSTLESWVQRRPGYLPMCRVGRLVKYRKKDLDEFIEKNIVRTSAEVSSNG